MAQTTFEIYAFDGARWTLQRTFTGAQREPATAWAQELYAQPHVKGVRLIQETYDPESGETAEKSLMTRTKSDVVPKNLNKEVRKPAEPAKPAARGMKAAAVASRAVPGIPQPPESPKPVPSAGRAAPAEHWHRTPRGRATSLTAASGAVIAGGALLVLQFPTEAPLGAHGAAAAAQHFFAVAIVLLGAGLAGAGFVLLDTAGQRGLLPGLFYVDGPAGQAQAGTNAAAAAMPIFPAIELEEDEAPPAAEAAPGLPPDALRLIAFFHDALAALPADAPYMKGGKLDAFNRFGCHLFFAGLCDEAARQHAWPTATGRELLSTALTATLADPKVARRFAARYDEYLTEPRSLAMFGCGAAAARQRAAGDARAKDALREALGEWNRKNDAAPATGHVAVMFTDIVGSTEFTQTHGDAKHYEMVQAHDRIVRAALQEFAGREIKHTGDGIMAAFDDAGLGVRAAQRVQREIRAHREVSPEIGMKLRIGLAAGEPIKAGADLFGSTVQLAARVCALARGDQILLTDPVRTICDPLGIGFADLGEQPLKGFRQPVRVHAVMED